jgi:hypothetical protein
MWTILLTWQIKRKNRPPKSHLLLARSQNPRRLTKRKKVRLLLKHPKKALQSYHLKSQQQAAVVAVAKASP